MTRKLNNENGSHRNQPVNELEQTSVVGCQNELLFEIEQSDDEIVISSKPVPLSNQIIAAFYGVPPAVLLSIAVVACLWEFGKPMIFAIAVLPIPLIVMWLAEWFPKRPHTVAIDFESQTISYHRWLCNHEWQFGDTIRFKLRSLLVLATTQRGLEKLRRDHFWSRFDLIGPSGKSLLIARCYEEFATDKRTEDHLELAPGDALIQLVHSIENELAVNVGAVDQEEYLRGGLGWISRRLHHPFLIENPQPVVAE